MLGVVSGVAPFFGPAGAAIGAGAGAIRGIGQANKATSQANAYGQMTKEQIEYLKKQQSILAPLLQSSVDMAGKPAYAGYTGFDPYGDEAQSAAYSLYGEDSGRAADSGVASLVNDYARRGIVGGAGIDRGIQGIRSNASADLARYRSALRERGGIAKFQQYREAEDARFQRMQPLLQTLLQTQGQISNGIGGQQSLYQGQANAANAGIGGALGTVASSIYGAGNNRLGTNQVGSNPYGTPPFVPSNLAPLETPAIQYGGGSQYQLGRRLG